MFTSQCSWLRRRKALGRESLACQSFGRCEGIERIGTAVIGTTDVRDVSILATRAVPASKSSILLHLDSRVSDRVGV